MEIASVLENDKGEEQFDSIQDVATSMLNEPCGSRCLASLYSIQDVATSMLNEPCGSLPYRKNTIRRKHRGTRRRS